MSLKDVGHEKRGKINTGVSVSFGPTVFNQ